MKNLKFYIVLLVVCTALFSGCAKEKVSLNSVKLLAAVKTGISIQSSKQLEKCRENIVNDAKQGNISKELEQNLLDTIQLAESGKWSEAEEMILKIQKQCTLDVSDAQHDINSSNHKH